MVHDEAGDAEKESEEDEKHVQTFLQEIRILVPGAQIMGGFLFSVPFQQRFDKLTSSQRSVFLITFASILIALILCLAPAAYHRLRWPIRDKRRFIALGTRFVIAGFVSLAISTTLGAHLIASMVLGEGPAAIMASALGLLIAATWFAAPLLKIHERLRAPPH
jgi:hypothetical protein